jgi:tetratricopeptide (TPR) repeat protein
LFFESFSELNEQLHYDAVFYTSIASSLDNMQERMDSYKQAYAACCKSRSIILFLQAINACEQGEYALADQFSEKVFVSSPENMEFLAFRILCLMNVGDFDEADVLRGILFGHGPERPYFQSMSKVLGGGSRKYEPIG